MEQARLTLVLVLQGKYAKISIGFSSIYSIGQTNTIDWLSQITDEIVTFQLCSSKDTTKKDDEYIIEKKDLGMTIETDPIILKKWLNKYKNKIRLYFLLINHLKFSRKV